MEVFKRSKEWFFTAEAKTNFDSLQNVEDRAMFLCSFLKSTTDGALGDATLFKLAFLLADAVHTSDVDYAEYPKLITPMNPFIAFVTRAKTMYPAMILNSVLLLILHGQVDPSNDAEWIYDTKLLQSGEMKDKLITLKCSYMNSSKTVMQNPQYYEIDKSMELIQLEILWLFERAVTK